MNFVAPTDILSSTVDFFDKITPSPSPKNQSTQIGVHFEEVAEMVEALEGRTPGVRNVLDKTAAALKELSAMMKQDWTAVRVADRNEFLDAMCDQIVTATGSVHFQSMDILGAMTEVNASNHSKFVNGEPVFDENLKLVKGPDYFKPNLLEFL